MWYKCVCENNLRAPVRRKNNATGPILSQIDRTFRTKRCALHNSMNYIFLTVLNGNWWWSVFIYSVNAGFFIHQKRRGWTPNSVLSEVGVSEHPFKNLTGRAWSISKNYSKTKQNSAPTKFTQNKNIYDAITITIIKYNPRDTLRLQTKTVSFWDKAETKAGSLNLEKQLNI